MNMRAEQPRLSLRVLLFLQLSNFSIIIIHYHLRSISNFALNLLGPGTDCFSHPSHEILHNLKAAEITQNSFIIFFFAIISIAD